MLELTCDLDLIFAAFIKVKLFLICCMLGRDSYTGPSAYTANTLPNIKNITADKLYSVKLVLSNKSKETLKVTTSERWLPK